MLNRMKAKHSHVRNASDAVASKLRAECVASVFDDNYPVTAGNLMNFVEIGGMPCIVDRQQRLSTRRDTFQNTFRIDVQRISTNICEDRLSALIKNAVRSRRER